MSGPHDNMRFGRIETRAVTKGGKVVTAWYSYPLGVGKDVYDRIDSELRRIYGNDGSSTIGTPIGHPNLSVERPSRLEDVPADPAAPAGLAMVVVVGIDILEFGDIQSSETFSVNRTVEGAAREIVAYVEKQLERRSMTLTEQERDMLVRHISAKDGINLVEKSPDNVDGVDRGRMLDMAGILNSTFGLRVQELGA